MDGIDHVGEEAVEQGSLRSQFSRMIRDSIVEQAMACFRENGYRATTVKAIAKAANTTHTTFYKFFNSKLDLLLAASDIVRPEMDLIVEKLSEIDPVDTKALRNWVDDYAEIWERRQAIFEAVWVSVYSNPDFAHQVDDETKHMADVYRVGADNVLSAPDDALTQELALIMMTTHPMFSSAMRAPDKQKRDSMLDLITNVLSRSLNRPGGWIQPAIDQDGAKPSRSKARQPSLPKRRNRD